jgi:hypothetical protein
MRELLPIQLFFFKLSNRTGINKLLVRPSSRLPSALVRVFRTLSGKKVLANIQNLLANLDLSLLRT